MSERSKTLMTGLFFRHKGETTVIYIYKGKQPEKSKEKTKTWQKKRKKSGRYLQGLPGVHDSTQGSDHLYVFVYVFVCDRQTEAGRGSGRGGSIL